MTDVPLNESVVRYASPRHVHDGRVNGGAFLVRANDPTLSVNRPAALSHDTDLALTRIRELARLKIKPAGRYAELPVEGIVIALTDVQEMDELQVLEDLLAATEEFEEDNSHAIIVGLPSDGGPMAELCGDLLSKRISGVHLAVA